MRQNKRFFVQRPHDWCEVEIWFDEATNKWCFVNMTKGHVCACRFDTVEDALKDLEQQKQEGKVIRYF